MTSDERALTLAGLLEASAVLVSVLVFKTSEISLAGLVGSIPIRFRFDASLTAPMMKGRRVFEVRKACLRRDFLTFFDCLKAK